MVESMKNTIIILAALLFMLSCSTNTNEIKDTVVDNETLVTLTDAQYKNSAIQTEKLAKRQISTTLKLNGKIDVPPQNMVSVSTPFGGFLKSSKLLPGMRIKKGEVLATMEDQQYIQLQQDYLTAKSKLIYFENEYNRQKELNISKASSDKVFQQTEMEYKTQKISVSALGEKLRLININPLELNETNLSRTISVYSSIDGFVSKVNVNIGKYVNPSDVLFELINPEDIHLNLKVFEKDLGKISIGQKLIAFNNNQPDKKHKCEIILISQDLSADRSVDVHCHFEDYDKTLLPGMYMNAEVEIDLANALTTTTEAIVSFEGKDFVFIQKDKLTFQLIEVLTGSTENGFTEITAAGADALTAFPVVTKGAYSLLMQLKNKSE
ncbi:MAG: efflux RND transporter periplasmic adaptor subunit [Bacteroidia bacterium]|nr:efflux RND transporter periplasmic adaptor subunit [Bacteroidia bacterium]